MHLSLNIEDLLSLKLNLETLKQYRLKLIYLSYIVGIVGKFVSLLYLDVSMKLQKEVLELVGGMFLNYYNILSLKLDFSSSPLKNVYLEEKLYHITICKNLKDFSLDMSNCEVSNNQTENIIFLLSR